MGPPLETEWEDPVLAQVLALLNTFVSGPTVPPLPPDGCYGGLYVSSAVSEGLGTEAAEAAKAAAEGLGERPVKVLLPWYPSGIVTFDQTQPAKLHVSEEPSEEKIAEMRDLREQQLARMLQPPAAEKVRQLPTPAPQLPPALLMPPPGVPQPPSFVASR